MKLHHSFCIVCVALLAMGGTVCDAQESDDTPVERTGHRIVKVSPKGESAEAEVKNRRVVRVFSTSGAIKEDGDAELVWVDENGPGSYGYSFGPARSRGYLGVQLVEMTTELRAHFGAPEDAGVLVSLVAEDSPAARAGLQVGDVVTAIDEKSVAAPSEVTRRISDLEEGASVSLEVWRDKRVQMLSAIIEERERPAIDVGQFLTHGVNLKFRKEVKIDLGSLPEHIIEIDQDGIHDALRDLQLKFQDPGMFEKFQVLGQDRIDLQERIQELEARLKELELHIEKLPEP